MKKEGGIEYSTDILKQWRPNTFKDEYAEIMKIALEKIEEFNSHYNCNFRILYLHNENMFKELSLHPNLDEKLKERSRHFLENLNAEAERIRNRVG